MANQGIPAKWSTKAGGICVGDSGRRQIPKSAPQPPCAFTWAAHTVLGRNVIFTVTWYRLWGSLMMQNVGLSHSPVLGKGKGKLIYWKWSSLKSRSSNFCHAWRMQRKCPWDTKICRQCCFKSSPDAFFCCNIPNFIPKDTNQHFSTNSLKIPLVLAEL